MVPTASSRPRGDHDTEQTGPWVLPTSHSLVTTDVAADQR